MTLLALVAAALLAVVATAVDPRNTKVPQGHGLQKFPAPDVRFNVYGVIVQLPPDLFVFYDGDLFEPSSTVVTVSNAAGSTSNCTTNLETFFEYSKTPFEACLNPILGQNGASYTITAKLELRSTGQVQTFTTTIQLIQNNGYSWPLENDNGGWPPAEPNLVGNTMENYQSFSGAAAAYWHQGFDIRGEALQECHSPVDGEIVQLVKYSSSDLYWSLMVQDPQGFIWQFHHLDIGTINFEIGDAVKTGDVLGNIARWPSSHNNALYHHTHMNIVLPDPAWTSIPEPYIDGWQYFNGFHFFSKGNYTNKEVPQSNGIFYYLEDGSDSAFASSEDGNAPTVSGAIDIVLQLSSEFSATNSLPGHPYESGVYELAYTVEPVNVEASSEPLPVLKLIEMDKLPNQWTTTLPDLGVVEVDEILRHVYRQQFTYDGRIYRSVFTYEERTLYYTVTNSLRGEPNPDGAWDTAQILPDGTPRFPNGVYLIKVYATDFYGGKIELEHTVTVEN